MEQKPDCSSRAAAPHRAAVAASFDRAAGQYEQHAAVQAVVAARLADRIAALRRGAALRILEIGCGTGFLGAALVDRLPGAYWIMTDVAPAMVEASRRRFSDRPRIAVSIMDGEAPTADGPFDLICSSLAMQWFGDLPAAIERLRSLLAPGGHLAFTTLAHGSFAEWRDAHEGPSGLHDYPSEQALRALGLDVSIETFMTRHDDARGFLQAFKAIGAGRARADHRPVAPAALRRAMRRFEEGGARGRYVVATCITEPRTTGETPGH